jgi:hypothetical protein
MVVIRQGDWFVCAGLAGCAYAALTLTAARTIGADREPTSRFADNSRARCLKAQHLDGIKRF